MSAARRWALWSTYVEVVVNETRQLDAACDLLARHLERVELACSRFRPDSELETLPPEGGDVSELLAHLLRIALDAAEETGGAVDPTVGNAVVALGYDRDIRLVLDDAPAIPVTTAVPGWRQVRLDGRQVRVPPGTRLDLGATAKAAAADAGADLIAAELAGGVLVNLGGDIATAGPAPEQGWQVTVRDLEGDPAGQVTLHGCLATSSTARRTWRRAGRRMHHIIDPGTGLPAPTRWRTVTVVAPTCVRANTVSTACIVRGDGALPWLRTLGLPARLVDHELHVLTVNGWPTETVHAA